MEDIAGETDLSRASLYSHFKNKEEIFREISVALHEDALAEAEGLLNDREASLEARIEGALAARLVRIHEVGDESPHGSEVCDEANRLCGDVVADSTARFHEMLMEAFQTGVREDEVDLDGADLSPEAAAELLRLGSFGLTLGAPDRQTFERRLRSLVRVFFAGLG